MKDINLEDIVFNKAIKDLNTTPKYSLKEYKKEVLDYNRGVLNRVWEYFQDGYNKQSKDTEIDSPPMFLPQP